MSEGCRNCYAEKVAARFSGPGAPYEGLVEVGAKGARWNGQVKLVHEHLGDPLRWRKPRRIFVNSMSDLFHEDVPDDFIAEVFAVMAVCAQPFYCGRERAIKRGPSEAIRAPYTQIKLASKEVYGPHIFQVLTKRPARAAALLSSHAFRSLVAKHAYRHAYNRTDCGYIAHQIGTQEEYGRCYPPGRMWPLPNVWLGVSVEDQATADTRIPILLDLPAAVRFISAEPLLGPIYFGGRDGWLSGTRSSSAGPGIDWVIVGGESGPGARVCDVAWIRMIVAQCQEARTACFVKQLGAHPVDSVVRWFDPMEQALGVLLDRKGGDIEEWPKDLRVRQMPRGDER